MKIMNYRLVDSKLTFGRIVYPKCFIHMLAICFVLRQNGKDVFVELDVGSEDNYNKTQIQNVLYSVVREGSIASYVTSVMGFEFRRLGERKDPEYRRVISLIAFLTFSLQRH